MYELKEKALALKEEMDELKDSISKMMLDEFGFEELLETEPVQLEMLKRSYRIMGTSMELMVDQAEALDQINEKLDRLLASNL